MFKNYVGWSLNKIAEESTIVKRIRIMRLCFTLTLISVLLSVQSNAQESAAIPPVDTVVSPDTLFQEIRSELQKAVKEGELPSVAIGVIHKDNVLWQEALGWADKENKVPATTATSYGLASVGKSVTATGVTVLVDQGKVVLDSPVGPYIAPTKLSVGTLKAATSEAFRVSHF